MSDPHQEGTPAGTSPADLDRRSAIAEALGKEVWPADRDALLARAQQNNATDRVLGDLRRLPSGQQFENVQDVARALGIGTEQQRF
jgi:hypothetical protein